jgi:hypothetical protein
MGNHMSSSETISEIKIKEKIHSFCQALSMKNLDKLGNLLDDHATLNWGPYKFNGKDKILTWAGELHELFPFMSFKEKSLEVSGTSAKHEFMIAFMTPQGQKGWLPCEGSYEFKGNRILNVNVNLLHGFLAVSREDIERVKPHPTNR